MPYIKQIERDKLDPLIGLLSERIMSEGALNYVITNLVLHYTPDACYTDYAGVLGTLEAVKLELYRRKVAGYEDGKAAENGDVF